VSASEQLDSTPRESRASGPSIAAAAGAITDISERVLKLVQEEIELAKSEVAEKVSSLLSGAVVAAAAGAFVVGALMLLLIGFSLLVSYLLPVETSEFFWGFFVVAVILLLLAALAGYIAARAMRAGAPPVPTMAVEEARLIRETVGTTPDSESPAALGAPGDGGQTGAAALSSRSEGAAGPHAPDGSDG
jgi:uncharacterized membrane protein YqjE